MQINSRRKTLYCILNYLFKLYTPAEGGLIIDLDTRIREYLPFTSTKGFMLYLRSPNETLVSSAPSQSYYY